MTDRVTGILSGARGLSAVALKISSSPFKFSARIDSAKFFPVSVIVKKNPKIGNISHPPMPTGPDGSF